MKSILMSELVVGDIFCYEVKLHGREAFLVKEVKIGKVVCQSRITGLEVRKQINGYVVWLRHE
jgi:hypothetical protein